MAPFNLCDHLLDRHVREGRGGRAAHVVGDRVTTYAELAGAAAGVAAGLRRLGVAPGDRVLLVLLDGVEFTATYLGAQRLGAVPVPVNALLAGPDLAVAAGSAGCAVAVVSAQRTEVIEGLTAGAPGLRDIVITGPAPAGDGIVRLHGWAGTMTTPDGAPPHPVADDDPGYWLCTGGTTGRPKLVMHRQQDMVATARTYGRDVLRAVPDDVFFGVAPQFHAFGLTFSVAYPLSVGACAVLDPQRPPTCARVAEALGARRPTVFYSVPTFYAALAAGDLPADAFASVRIGVSAGEVLPAEVAHRFRERFGVPLSDVVGSTELAAAFLSDGRMVPGYEERLLDAAGRPVADGRTGELWVRGPSAATGYFGLDEASAATFVDGWTRTRDLYVRGPEGRLACLGRADELFKVAGEWVSPPEVEAVVLEHPDVAEAAVVGRPRADGILEVVAYVVEAPVRELSEASVVEFCRGRLAGYKRPRRVVVVDALPRTAVGKLRRATLGTGPDLVGPRRGDVEPVAVVTGLRRAVVGGVELEYELRGTGEPLLLIHGSHVAASFRPLLGEAELGDRYTLIRYHRRGYHGSARVGGPLSMAGQAADARALLEHLGVRRAHVAGHSYGGAIALQLALDAPELVHSLVLLEPALLSTPAGAQVSALVEAARERYDQGDWSAAEDLFLGTPQERAALTAASPGAIGQALRDMDAYFSVEVPAHDAWRFGREEAARVRCPVLHLGGERTPPLYREIRAALQEWLPAMEAVTVSGATHLLHMQEPAAVAAAMRRFLAGFPLPGQTVTDADAPAAAPALRRPVARERFNAATDLLEGHLEAGRGDLTALRTPDGDTSYAELAASVDRAGGALRDLGVRPGDRVVIAMADSPAFVAAFLGAVRAGAVPVPLATMGEAGDYAAIVDDAQARVAVCDAAVAERFAGTANVVTDLDGGDADLPPAETTRDDPAFLLYGADARGRAKGVVHLQGTMRACADAYGRAVLGLAPGDVTFSSAGLHLAFGLGNGLYLPLAAGATSVLITEPALPRLVRHVLRRFRVTVHFATPSDLGALVAARPRADEIEALRLCAVSGGPLPGGLLKRFTDATGVEVLEGMGSIETGHVVISNRPGAARPGSAGVLVDGYEARLVDEHGRDVPTGEPGRLLVRGESVLAGYWRNRRLTADALLGDWLRTGEVFSRDDDGRFFHHGRRDDMLVMGGALVSPQEIEEVLLEDEHVRDCAVVGLPDADRLMRPEAFVVADREARLEEALRQLVRRRLGGDKTPRAFHFVAGLPRGADGAVRREDLRSSAPPAG